MDMVKGPIAVRVYVMCASVDRSKACKPFCRETEGSTTSLGGSD